MITKINDLPYYNLIPHKVDNLTKRDFFAAMAMHGYRINKFYSDHSSESIAEFSVGDADALIAELNKEVQS